MTRKTIENPTVDDVRVGDVVSMERGTPGMPGHRLFTYKVVLETPTVDYSYMSLATTRDRIRFGECDTVTLTREVPDLPDHAGALAFTDDGLAMSDGEDDGLYPWVMSSGESRTVGQFPHPVAAVAVPLDSYRQAQVAYQSGSDDDRIAALGGLIEATRYEHQRAGLPEVK